MANKDFTHFLQFDLAESSVLPQMEASLQRFRRDPLATDIPEKAFRPQVLLRSLFIGRLKLNQPQRREEFSKFLHSLEYNKLIGPAGETAQLSSEAREHIDMARSLSHVVPLRINMSGLTSQWRDQMSGLTSQWRDPSTTRKLSVWAVDPTGRLRPFFRSLIEVFEAAGFPILKPHWEPLMEIVSIYNMSWGEPSPLVVQPNGKKYYRKTFRYPTFDSRELLKKYENEIWATDIPVERLSLREVGASEKDPDGERVFKEKPEVDSVALP